MVWISPKITDRISEGLKRLQPILASAKSRDVNESDTVTITVDLLSEVFGYDRYTEITREFAIRNTYCDLAIKLDSKVALLIEVKAIGLELKDAHVKQAVDYAANQGIEWVALTNGNIWQVYRVTFGKPINHEKVFETDLLILNHRKKNEMESLYILSREGIKKSALEEYDTLRQAMSKYTIGALLTSAPVISKICRQLKNISPEVKVQPEDIKQALLNEIIKRDVIEGERAEEACKKVDKAIKKMASQKTTAAPRSEPEPESLAARPASNEQVEGDE